MWNQKWKKADGLLKKWKMLEKGDAVLLGISGGADSICLARYFLEKKDEFSLKLYAVHVNHMLRGKEAERDQRFVEAFCEEHGIVLETICRDIQKESRENKCSLEEAGRNARYDCFETYARKYGCTKIAIAHHQKDAAETIVFRMLRGTGIRGMAGILPVNGRIIRPFLDMKKEEITEILREMGQEYMEDATNTCENYSRNFIRHRILPEMEQLNPQAAGHIRSLGEQVQDMLEFLEPQMEALYKEKVVHAVCVGSEAGIFLSRKDFLGLSRFEKKEILRRMLFEESGHRKDISSVHVEQLLSLMDKKEGKMQNYPYGVVARRVREGIVLEHSASKAGKKKRKAEEGPKKPEPIWPVFQEGKAEIFLPNQNRKVTFAVFAWDHREIVKKDCVKYFDYDKIECKICVRTRLAGDYFIMDKEGRRKSLGRYFIDTKIPADRRDEQLLLADGAHIMWVLDGRISEFYKVDSGTKTVLSVSIESVK